MPRTPVRPIPARPVVRPVDNPFFELTEAQQGMLRRLQEDNLRAQAVQAEMNDNIAWAATVGGFQAAPTAMPKAETKLMFEDDGSYENIE